jgi:transposase
VIPGRRNRSRSIRFSKQIHRLRDGIERAFGKKVSRAITTGCDESASSLLAMIYLAVINFWLRFFLST